MTDKRNSHFQRNSGVYQCMDCGKQTRDTGTGEGNTVYEGKGLCANCYDKAGWENCHNDECHSVTNPDPSCRICKEAGYIK